MPIQPPRLPKALSRMAISPPRRRDTANDNAAESGPTRSLLREILFLGILAASLYGAFLAGRTHGAQRVIVVPGPVGFYSAVT